MHFDAIQLTPTNCVIQVSAVPGLSHVIAPRGNGLKCSLLTYNSKKSHRNPYSRMKDVCLWSHVALTGAVNICVHSFPLPLIVYELLDHSTQISEHHHET